MKQHISFPSIDQFRNTVKSVKSYCDYNNVDYPTLTFTGTTKIHGSNGGIVYNPATDELWCQSRENIITIEKDNAGFAWFVESRKDYFKSLLIDFAEMMPEDKDIVVIFGEFAGGNIQKGVAVSGIDKFFVAFDVYFAKDNEDKVRAPVSYHKLIECRELRVYNSFSFDSWIIPIDFSNPGASTEEMVNLTNQVEACCPVGKFFGVEGVGEGIVWTSVSNIDWQQNHRFKVKGEKHSVSKVKTGTGVAAISPEVMASIDEFVNYAVTPERMEQGIQRVFTEQGKEPDIKDTGVYLKWLFSDIMKEEHDVLAESNLEPKQVSGPISKAGRTWFMERINIV